MSKPFYQKIPKKAWFVIVPLVGWMLYDGFFPASSSTTSSRRSTARSRSTTSTSKAAGQFTEEDYKAKFTAYNKTTRNVFNPLVKKSDQNVRAAAALGAGNLPSDLTGGETNWMYTGFGSVNGVRQGLLENQSTSDSVFLTEGQRWRGLTVQRIEAEQMVVLGPSGAEVTIPVGETNTEQSAAPGVVPPNGGTAPVNPAGALAGPIGQIPGGTNPADLRVVPDSGQSTGMPTGRSRRNRGRGN